VKLLFEHTMQRLNRANGLVSGQMVLNACVEDHYLPWIRANQLLRLLNNCASVATKFEALGDVVEPSNHTGAESVDGSARRGLVHEDFHVTIDANGSVTAFVDNFSVDCR
jgi:hypothetical protein